MTFTTPGRTITESDLVSFAALTGDRHPQHTDAEWCIDSPFGERVAHGMLLLSYAIGLMPLDPERVAALRGIENAVFKRPVRVGDTIHVEVSEPAADENGGLAAHDLRIVNQDGRLVARATLKVVLAPEPADDAKPDGAVREDQHLDGAPVLL